MLPSCSTPIRPELAWPCRGFLARRLSRALRFFQVTGLLLVKNAGSFSSWVFISSLGAWGSSTGVSVIRVVTRHTGTGAAGGICIFGSRPHPQVLSTLPARDSLFEVTRTVGCWSDAALCKEQQLFVVCFCIVFFVSACLVCMLLLVYLA